MSKSKIFSHVIFVLRQKADFHDSDLIFPRIFVSVESNAFWTLLKATNELYWPKSLENKFVDLSSNTNWDDSLAADVLKKNQTCLDLFDESLKQPFLLVPELKTFDDDSSYLDGWRTISLVESIQAISLFRAKKEKEAFDTALKIIQFGQRVENSGGPTLYYLVGSSIKTRGLLRIQQMTADTTLSETDLIQLIRELENFKPNQEGFVNALKVEYQTQAKFCDDFATGKIPMQTNSAFVRSLISISIMPLFNATKTKTEYAQSARVVRDNFSKPFGKIPWLDLPVVEIDISVWHRVISGNAIGDVLFGMSESVFKGVSSRKSREDVNVMATQLLLALKIYKMRHDKLPDSLSELTPDFFSQIPIDDFDGKPFRYLPEKKIIFSVGPDLKDSGGVARHKGSDDYDLPFKIEF
jgi:hypothetical protein